ncbi:MAG: hypothetical protein LQ352_004457, partial [Teloschistes flavicans]
MLASKPQHILLALLATSPLCTPLRITITHWFDISGYTVPVASICDNALPGECCTLRQEIFDHYQPHRIENSDVSFLPLLTQQLGAVWAIGGDITPPIMRANINVFPKCQGAPVLRVPGPDPGRPHETTEWAVDNSFHHLAYSATWIDLRTRFPPNSAES